MPKTIQALEKSKSITSLNLLKQSLEIIDSDLVDFEIENINKGIENLSKEKRDIDFGMLKAIYTEAQSYVPDLQKNFEEMVNFHNSMIQNRIDFIKRQLYKKQLFEILKEKEKNHRIFG